MYFLSCTFGVDSVLMGQFQEHVPVCVCVLGGGGGGGGIFGFKGRRRSSGTHLWEAFALNPKGKGSGPGTDLGNCPLELCKENSLKRRSGGFSSSRLPEIRVESRCR